MRSPFSLVLTLLIFFAVHLITLFGASPKNFSFKKSWLLFFLGIASCLILPFVQNLLHGFLGRMVLSETATLFLSAFLLSGLLEESIKLLILLLFFFHNHQRPQLAESWRAAFHLILGFCMVENILYIMKTSSNFFSRFLLAVPLHWGAIFYGSWLLTKATHEEKISKRNLRMLSAFLLPTFLHGIYNFLLLLGETHQNQPGYFIQLNNRNFFFLFCVIEVIMMHSILVFIYHNEKKKAI